MNTERAIHFPCVVTDSPGALASSQGKRAFWAYGGKAIPIGWGEG